MSFQQVQYPRAIPCDGLLCFQRLIATLYDMSALSPSIDDSIQRPDLCVMTFEYALLLSDHFCIDPHMIDCDALHCVLQLIAMLFHLPIPHTIPCHFHG